MIRAARHQERNTYLLELSEAEALELHEFLSDRARPMVGGYPCLEIRVANELYSAGLQDIYKKKWHEEYDLSR